MSFGKHSDFRVLLAHRVSEGLSSLVNEALQEGDDGESPETNVRALSVEYDALAGSRRLG